MRNWEKLYNTYSKKFAIAEEQMDRIGLKMKPKLTRPQFITAYSMEENSKLNERNAGTRKVLNTMQDLISSQKPYKMKFKEARRISKYANEYYREHLDEQFYDIERDLIRDGYSEKYINRKKKEFYLDSKINYKDFLYGNETKTEAFWNIVKDYADNRLLTELTVGQMFFGSPE